MKSAVQPWLPLATIRSTACGQISPRHQSVRFRCIRSNTPASIHPRKSRPFKKPLPTRKSTQRSSPKPIRSHGSSTSAAATSSITRWRLPLPSYRATGDRRSSSTAENCPTKSAAVLSNPFGSANRRNWMVPFRPSAPGVRSSSSIQPRRRMRSPAR